MTSNGSPGDDGVHPLVARVRPGPGRTGVGLFVRALLMPLAAAGFLRRHRALWGLALAPAALHLLVFGGLASLVVLRADAVAARLAEASALGGRGLGAGVEGMLWAVVLVVGLVVAYVAALVLAGLFASPFNDVLAARTERRLTGRVAGAERSLLGEAFVAVATTLSVALLYGAALALVLLLGLVPGVGPLAVAVLSPLVSAFFLTLECADFTLARRGLPLGAKLRLVRAHLPVTLGFGLGAALVLYVPVVNLLALPAAVVGGTAVAVALGEAAEDAATP
jgi:CysZ protein